jgi:hypothetical protein
MVKHRNVVQDALASMDRGGASGRRSDSGPGCSTRDRLSDEPNVVDGSSPDPSAGDAGPVKAAFLDWRRHSSTNRHGAHTGQTSDHQAQRRRHRDTLRHSRHRTALIGGQPRLIRLSTGSHCGYQAVAPEIPQERKAPPMNCQTFVQLIAQAQSPLRLRWIATQDGLRMHWESVTPAVPVLARSNLAAAA